MVDYRKLGELLGVDGVGDKAGLRAAWRELQMEMYRPSETWFESYTGNLGAPIAVANATVTYLPLSTAYGSGYLIDEPGTFVNHDNYNAHGADTSIIVSPGLWWVHTQVKWEADTTGTRQGGCYEITSPWPYLDDEEDHYEYNSATFPFAGQGSLRMPATTMLDANSQVQTVTAGLSPVRHEDREHRFGLVVYQTSGSPKNVTYWDVIMARIL